MVSRTDYAGSWVYEQPQGSAASALAFVHAAEGRLVPDAQSGQLEREYFYTDHLGNLRLVWKKGEELLHLTAETTADAEEQQKIVEDLDSLRTTTQSYEGDAGLLLAPQAELQGAGQLAVGEATAVLHFSLQAKAGADPNAPEMSGLRVQEEPSFSFGQELVRVNPIDAPAGAADGNSRLDRVSFNLPAILKAAGSLGRKSKRNNYLPGAQGNRFQPVEEPVFSTLRTTEPVEDCQPGSFYLHITSYNSLAEPIATKTLYLSSYCHWDSTNIKIKLPEGAEQVSWRLENFDSQLYVDEFRLTTIEIPQENHYYAFGLDMAGVSKTAANPHSYTYNSKELEAETGWHDYGARMYDGQTGRFSKIDRYSEKYASNTSYHYVLNNPIYNIDFNGDWTVPIHYSMTWSILNELNVSKKTLLSHYASVYADHPPAHLLLGGNLIHATLPHKNGGYALPWLSFNKYVNYTKTSSSQETSWNPNSAHENYNVWHSMRSSWEAENGMSKSAATSRGLAFGVSKIFDAAESGVTLNHLKVNTPSIEDLGQGLHAIQDAFAHFGTHIVDFDHLMNDMSDKENMQRAAGATKEALIAYKLLTNDFENIKPEDVTFEQLQSHMNKQQLSSLFDAVYRYLNQ